MGELRPLSTRDLSGLRRYLAAPSGLHIYLESRLDALDEGDGFVYRERGRIDGFAWFGAGRNFVVAGGEPDPLRALCDLAVDRESTWLMLVAPKSAAADILRLYLPRTRRRTRLDRPQTIYRQTRETVADLAEPALRPARETDLGELVPISARMSSEDFEIDYWRIDKHEVHRSIHRKIREERSWVYREEERIVFKADVAVTCPSGVQIEGVYTVEDRRGRGIASRCMAELGRRILEKFPMVTLHAATTNHAAQRAYERAGFRPGEELRLTIFTP